MISLQFDQINPADSAKDDVFVGAQFEESLVKSQAPVKTLLAPKKLKELVGTRTTHL